MGYRNLREEERYLNGFPKFHFVGRRFMCNKSGDKVYNLYNKWIDY